MIVKALYSNCKHAPSEVLRLGFSKSSVINLTKGNAYTVYAFSVFNGVVFLCILDDLDNPAWLPSFLFETIDSSMPKDWNANLLKDEPALVVGPEFISKDQEAYEQMVELLPSKVEQFRKQQERYK